MALAMVFMLYGGVRIHAVEELVETPQTAQDTAQDKAAPAASLDTAELKNAEASLETAADGSLTLVVKAKDGYYFADSPLASADNSYVSVLRKSDSTAMVCYYKVSVFGSTPPASYTIKIRGAAAVLTSSKLILNRDNLVNASVTAEKEERITPLDHVILTVEAEDKKAFKTEPYAIIDGEKRNMRMFGDENTMYTLSLMNIHKDTTIELYGTAVSTEEKATLDNMNVTGYVNEKIASYGTITLENAAFHKLAKGTDISSWFFPLPKGMQVTTVYDVAEGSSSMQIEFSGTPLETSNEAMGIIIEGQYTTGREILKVDTSGSKWAIHRRTAAIPVIEKGNQTYEKGSNKPLELICSGELRELYGIFINGSAISADSYTLTSGSTVLTLKPEYLETLEKGSYTVRFTYDDGNYAETKVTIADKADKKLEASTLTNQEGAPNTADATSTGLLLIALLTSGAGMAAVTAKRKRARQ